MKLCLGTVQLGLDYGIKGGKRASDEECIQILEHAICNRGIDTIDTAPGYGKSQQIIGEFIKRNSDYADRIKCISKIPAVGDNYASIDTIRSGIEECLITMGIAKIDGMLLHNENDIFNDALLSILLKMQSDGIISHFGVSTYTTEPALYAATINELDYIQIPYNVFDRRLDDTGFFAAAKKHEKTIFARSIFLQGLLLMENPPVKKAIEHVHAFHEICSAYNVTPAEACIQYILGNNAIDYALFGVDVLEEIDANLKALNGPDNKSLQMALQTNIRCDDEEVLMPQLWRKG